jgi:hypothetical protein
MPTLSVQAAAVAGSGSLPDQPEAPSVSSVSTQAQGKGFAFYPSTTQPGAFRLALGAYYDAIDPAVMYGMNFRLPQFSMDARYGLGQGWSLKGHLNTMFVTTELLFGGSYAQRFERWSWEASLSAGIFIGKLAQFGFDALLLSPDFRPELAIGYDLGKIALTFRGSLILMGAERVRVGEVWGELDNDNPFVGHSEMLFVENTTSDDSIWYFGAGVMTTRAFYALWVLFPDSPSLYTYPRIVAGYEF